MTVLHHDLLIATSGRGFVEISADLRKVVADGQVRQGLCHLFLHHTSASLVVMENADPFYVAAGARRRPDLPTYCRGA